MFLKISVATISLSSQNLKEVDVSTVCLPSADVASLIRDPTRYQHAHVQSRYIYSQNNLRPPQFIQDNLGWSTWRKYNCTGMMRDGGPSNPLTRELIPWSDGHTHSVGTAYENQDGKHLVIYRQAHSKRPAPTMSRNHCDHDAILGRKSTQSCW